MIPELHDRVDRFGDELKSVGFEFSEIEFKSFLDSEKDFNSLFLVDNRLVVVKVYNSAMEESDVVFQLEAMQIAAKSIKAPKLLFPLHAGQIPHIFNHVYMTTVTEFIPGQVLNRSIAVVPSELIRITERVGCVIRKMTKKFGMTKLRGRKKRLIWNFANFDSVVIELGACLESDLRKDFAALVPATSTALNEAFRDTSQFQLCHYDCNDDNIIVTDNDEIGIIDFGDVDLGPRVVDVSLACCYILINVFSTSEEVDPFYVKSVVESAMNGFTLTVPITDKERALIPVLIVARCIMSICIQSSQRCANPDNSEYLSVSFKGSRALLRFVNSVSLDKFISLFSSL